MLWLWLLIGCTAEEASNVPQVCQDLCTELAIECGYAAYPSYDSCTQGCVYNRSEGADVDGELACVTAAACNTFAIVECEHAHGLQ